ncbi:MAG: phosphoribosylformimino-5-aminoimidazole carboxamide ribotide isomerase [Hallerella sp.]|uniref:1-(5-phosphoribosyl)-5-[(5-phosphoribosylamino)methylideneamino] imidazole-4-carboxamide isomerase n=1 Tax=Hallerella porci TaxID=1945871 RepID=A0ABX5LNC5_9BACT|nr:MULTISPECIES: phosphoribosylformimino-5-aminoimidazole carboxamide ribotide isomerase [Hallerella]MCI5601079.1 phosphoribosylformimino-5-aminoimidazole carboxamide ribotide isomerase [Hallerella sp.]PWL03904.1 1-(5-phosphoribosyl)-5-[(5-phosphoribosylamino)methylideneamino] imidazole-4-carboxamide isomerase [Hallerella porci]
MTKFRPCIDIHQGKVKQIVGGTLSDSETPLTHFTSEHSPAYYAELYQKDGLRGGHVIMLGKGCEAAAKEALAAYPNGLQVGGGINPTNAQTFLDAGASHVIVTSWIFDGAILNFEKVKILSEAVGKNHLVLDLSCRRTHSGWNVATNRWQTITDAVVDENLLQKLAAFCDEFLVHAADVEGLERGMDEELVRFLAEKSPIPVTYAGGAKSIDDLIHCNAISNGKVDLTIGSSLDIFGGTGTRYAECVEFNKRQNG